VAAKESLETFDQLRRSPNRSADGGVTFPAAQVEADLAHAGEIVRSARATV